LQKGKGRDGEGVGAAISRFEANLVQEAGMILLLSSGNEKSALGPQRVRALF
jgi:hypothetical protein